jgi:hypothetical protein
MSNPMDKDFLLGYLRKCYLPDSTTGCWIWRGSTGRSTVDYPIIRVKVQIRM